MKIVEDFKKFAVKGNVVDMAVGIVIGTAFINSVKSLVSDIIMPLVGLVLGDVNFTELYVNLSGEEYESLAAAQEAGAATLNYGVFFSTIIDFLILAVVIFVVVSQLKRLRKKEEAKAPPPEPSDEVILLTEIRDLLSR